MTAASAAAFVEPEIVADAAYAILTKPSREFTGKFCLDDEVLRAAGTTDFTQYRDAGVREEDFAARLFSLTQLPRCTMASRTRRR